jgi:hypothetical protein
VGDRRAKESKRPAKRRLSKKWLLGLVTIVLLIIAGAACFLIFGSGLFKTKTSSPTKHGSTVVVSALASYYSSNQSALDQKLESAKDNKGKAWLYIKKSSLALNTDYFNEAYEFAKKAEALDPTTSSAQMMADAAAKKGDKADAIAKYKVAISRITGTTGMNKLDIESLQNSIKKLEQ